MSEIKITCPCCKTVISVSKRDGSIISARKPASGNSTGDKFKDAFLQFEEFERGKEGKLDAAQRDLENRRKSADFLFGESLKNKPPEPGGDDIL